MAIRSGQEYVMQRPRAYAVTRRISRRRLLIPIEKDAYFPSSRGSNGRLKRSRMYDGHRHSDCRANEHQSCRKFPSHDFPPSYHVQDKDPSHARYEPKQYSLPAATLSSPPAYSDTIKQKYAGYADYHP